MARWCGSPPRTRDGIDSRLWSWRTKLDLFIVRGRSWPLADSSRTNLAILPLNLKFWCFKDALISLMVVSFSCGHIFASHIYFAHFANMHFLNNINCYLHCKFTLTVHVHWLTKTLCAVPVFLEFQQNPCSVPMIPEETVSQQSSWWCRDAFMNRVVFGCVFKGLLCFVIYILWCLEALLWSNYCFLVLYFQAEGIFRINAENSQEEFVRDQLNSGIVPDGIDVHCLAGLIKVIFFLSWSLCL